MVECRVRKMVHIVMRITLLLPSMMAIALVQSVSASPTPHQSTDAFLARFDRVCATGELTKEAIEDRGLSAGWRNAPPIKVNGAGQVQRMIDSLGETLSFGMFTRGNRKVFECFVDFPVALPNLKQAVAEHLGVKPNISVGDEETFFLLKEDNHFHGENGSTHASVNSVLISHNFFVLVAVEHPEKSKLFIGQEV